MTQKSTHCYAIQGIGTDIIEIHRIKQAISRHGERFINRLFTEVEKQYCSKFKNQIPHFAARFAAKEAVLKALGTGLHPNVSWKDVEIINNNLGKPEVQLSPSLSRILSVQEIFLSVSHCEEYATATAIIIG